MANSTNANLVNRRNELMARLHGLEVYADKHGYVANFLTITCLSRMHAVHNSGRPNEKFDSTSPKQANQYFSIITVQVSFVLQRSSSVINEFISVLALPIHLVL
jgi:hypothetical protein